MEKRSNDISSGATYKNISGKGKVKPECLKYTEGVFMTALNTSLLPTVPIILPCLAVSPRHPSPS